MSAPDGAGALTSPVSALGYANVGNVVYPIDPFGNESTWTYTSTFNLVATATDALDNVTTFTYDTDGNFTKRVDPIDTFGSG